MVGLGRGWAARLAQYRGGFCGSLVKSGGRKMQPRLVCLCVRPSLSLGDEKRMRIAFLFRPGFRAPIVASQHKRLPGSAAPTWPHTALQAPCVSRSLLSDPSVTV